MNIHKLIEEITPLYNKYKNNNRTISGTDALIVMWEIGDILKEFIESENIAPHNLYRKVYGKSEGGSDIYQKSWITREFQGKCYRIRKIFKTKDQIYREFPTLQYFTAFREAMPFFDNPKYKLDPLVKEALMVILNSNKSFQYVLTYIRKLQKEKIGIKNPRTQKLDELEADKKIFIDFYNTIYELTKYEYSALIQKLKNEKIDANLIKFLAKNTSALSQDGLKFIILAPQIKTRSALWLQYFEMIKTFISNTNAKKVRRFRRLIPPERIVQLSDMLFVLSQKILSVQ